MCSQPCSNLARLPPQNKLLLPRRCNRAKVMLNRACRILQSSESQSSTGPSQSGSVAASAGLSSGERISLWKRLLLKINLLFQMIAMQVKAKTNLGEAAFNGLFPAAQPSLSSQASHGPTKRRSLKGQVVGQSLARGEGKKDSVKAHMDPTMCRHPETHMIPRGDATTKRWIC